MYHVFAIFYKFFFRAIFLQGSCKGRYAIMQSQQGKTKKKQTQNKENLISGKEEKLMEEVIGYTAAGAGLATTIGTIALFIVCLL